MVSFFQGTIAKWAALAVFMPIVAGMGGNAGTQTLTVFVRGLALGEIDWSSGWRPIWKEVLVGFGNGAANGLITTLIVGFWTGDWVLGCILFAAMVFNLVEAAQKSWRRLDGHNQLPKLVLGAKFTEGLEVPTTDSHPKAAA